MIELPLGWSDFFSEQGECQSFPNDQRRQRRFKARTRGLLVFEHAFQAEQRDIADAPVGIYSSDFSQRSCGLIAPFQVFPEEQLRILLPTFWLTVRVARCNQMGPCCYGVGATLVRQHAASHEAFDFPAVPLPVSAVCA